MKKRSASVIILTLVIIFSSVAFVGCGVGNKSPKSSGDISGSEIEVSVSESAVEGEGSESVSASESGEQSEVEPHTHEYVIVYDETGHWQECECGYKTEKVAHELVVAYDAEGHWQECECGYKTEKLAHELVVAYDAEGHWQECECGYKSEKLAHELIVAYDAEGHWQECECGYKSEELAHELIGAYDAEGHWQECECGYKTEKTDHTLVTIYDVDGYWQECECGYKTEFVAYDGYKRIGAPYGYEAEDFTLENFANTDKGLTFEYKPFGDRIEGDNDYVTFSLMSGWDRKIGYISVEVVADNIASGIGTIEDIGDGWKKVTIRCSEMTLDAADGSETIDRLYFHWVNHGFLLRNVAFVHVHTYETVFDEEGHWQECECGYKSEELAHELAGAYDEEGHWQECSCGYKTEKITHELTAVYDIDEYWYECSCGFKTEEQAYDGYKRISAPYDYTDEGFSLENFATSGKALSFEYKPTGDRIEGDNDYVTFSLMSGWDRKIGYISVEVVADNVLSGIGQIEDIGDGWRRFTVNCSEMALNGEGTETIDRLYFQWINHGFLLKNVGFTNEYRQSVTITSGYGYTAEDFVLENFANSSKALTFEYKPYGDRIGESENDHVGFSLMTGWTRRTEYFAIDVVKNEFVAGKGTIEDAGDGWYRVTMNFADMGINTGEGADGSETIDFIYFHAVNHGFKLANVGFIHVHTYVVAYNEDGHYFKCACGEKTETTAHVLEQRYDTENHWQECECGYKCNIEAHTFADGVCGKCGYESIITYQTSSVIVVGDVHIGKDTVNSTNLINTLEYVKNNNIEVVIFNGDSVDLATEENYAELDRCFTLVFGDVAVANRPEFLFNMGNHEFYPTGNCDCLETVYEREYGLFRQFANKWMKEPIAENENVYCRVIKGVYYIIAFPGNSQWASCGDYLEADFTRIKGYLDQAGAISRPCILATHWPWGYTYGGANYGNAPDEDTAAMKTLLAQYPFVINFTSHTHYTDLHERTFDQTDYTSINVGTHCFAKYVSGFEEDENGELIVYMNIDGHKVNKTVDPSANTLFWSGVTNFGIGINFGEENIVIKRVNLGTGSDYAHGTWTIPYGINADNKHDNFYYEAGERQGETLTFASNAQLDATLDASDENVTITLSFEDVEQYYSVEGYKIEIYDADNQNVYKTWWQSRFWADLGEKSSYSVTVSGIAASATYTIKVYPMDFFGVYGEPLVGNYELDLTHTVTYSATSSSYTWAAGEWDTFVAVANWNASNKALSFEYKPSDTTKGFYVQLLNGSDTQISEQLTITGGTLSGGHGTITALEDGWYRYECALSDIGVNGSNGAETFAKIKFRRGNLVSGVDTVKIRNVDTTKVLVHTVTYSASSSSYTWAAGEWNTFVAVENWNASNKVFSFEYKPSDTTKGFYVQLLNGSDTQISEQLTITGGTLSAGHGTITDIGDGWYRYECALSNIGVKDSNGAETFVKIKFRRGNLVSGVDTVIIRNVDTTKVVVHTVTYSASSSSYTYAAGEWSTFVAVDSWNTSDKVFSFEYKPSDTTKGFYVQLLNGSDTQISEQLTITGGTLSAGHGTIIDIGDGWYRYECALSNIGVKDSNGAETFVKIKFRRGNLVSGVDTVIIRNVDTTKGN